MHQRDARRAFALSGKVRVCVMRGRRAVCGPAGVRDTGKTVNGVLFDLSLQLCNALGTAGATQLAIGMHGNTAGVVTAILQAFEALKKNRDDIPLRHGADNATHRLAPIFGLMCYCAQEQEK